jgi:HTH-type transcriptional regulator/antitoxin HigA
MTVEAMLKAATEFWPKVAALTVPVTSKRQYQTMVKLLDAVLDAGGADERHPLASLAGILGERIEEYEATHQPIREITGVALVRELMKQHGLKQSEVPEIGPQSVVSLVLNGRRELNGDQIIRLSQRFGVPVEVLMD